MFDSATAAKLGTYTQLYSDWSGGKQDTLTLWLAYDATISVGNIIGLPTNSPVASRLAGIVVNAGSVALAAPADPEIPKAVLAGPASVGSGCDAAGSAVVLDAPSSYSAGRWACGCLGGELGSACTGAVQ